MLNIGLTGGIAAGKSTVATWLGELGAQLIDADALAREVVEPGTAGLAAVVAEFGNAILTARGELDRSALGRVVFADADARARLGAIVHPLVGQRTQERLAALLEGTIVVHDVPLIVENQLSDRYHLVVVVGASEDVRLRRLMQGRSMSAVDARARIAAQADDEARRRVADVWLDNEREQSAVRSEVAGLWASRLVPFAANIAAGEHAPRAIRPARLMDPPSGPRTWDVQAAQLLARIRTAVGDRIATADHIGSTSVPGLPAKDVIDLQLGVSDLSRADALDEPLRRAGYILRRELDQDHPKPSDPEPSRWSKRYYGNADPGRAVNLHVREVNSPGWRYALAFRDWLRADPHVRAEYVALKRRIAATTSSTGSYAEAKEPWFTEIHPRLERWATESGWPPR